MSYTEFCAGKVSRNQASMFAGSDESYLRKFLRKEDIEFEDGEEVDVYNENWDEDWGMVYVEGKGIFDFTIQESGYFGDQISIGINDLDKYESAFFLVFYNGGTCFKEMLKEFIQDNF